MEVFQHAVENTPGDDLHKVLWLKSSSSEVWPHPNPNPILSTRNTPIPTLTRTLTLTSQQETLLTLTLTRTLTQVWLNRRTNYTRSLAMMSMVGYLLGLGDRHPSNLMLDRYSGKILHIDFGDCFEASMNREKYPEKVPFRLTRMLVKAMEVSGIEGNFRSTCCAVCIPSPNPTPNPNPDPTLTQP